MSGFTAEELKAIKAVENALKKLPETVRIYECEGSVFAAKVGVHTDEALYDFATNTVMKIFGGGLNMDELHNDELIE